MNKSLPPATRAEVWVKEALRSASGWRRALREALDAPVAHLCRDVRAQAWETRALTLQTAAGLPGRKDQATAASLSEVAEKIDCGAQTGAALARQLGFC